MAAQTPVDLAGPHVLAIDVASCSIADDDRHHLARVLRLRDGDALTLTDGAGSWRTARFGAEIEPTGEVAFLDRPRPTLTVGFAVVKSAKPALIVQKLTELGIDRIWPFRAERSVANWDAAKAAKAQVRLERVAREALMQSKGVWLPTVLPVVGFDELVAKERERSATVVRADFGGADLAGLRLADEMAGSVVDNTGRDRDALASPGVTVLVGPEGGWSDSERNGVGDMVHLGHTVLRAETACIAVGVLLSAARRS